MTRTLGQLDESEREAVIAQIHQEATTAGWHVLTPQQKNVLYVEWCERFNLKHPAIKDGIMKGFDAAQHIPPSGEAAVHERLKQDLTNSGSIPYIAEKVTLWSGRARADFVIGFSALFLTHAIELESAPTWQRGLMQCLWYKSAQYRESGMQVLPTLILFGDVTAKRWNEIATTCLDQRALLLTYDLRVDGAEAPFQLSALLGGQP